MKKIFLLVGIITSVLCVSIRADFLGIGGAIKGDIDGLGKRLKNATKPTEGKVKQYAESSEERLKELTALIKKLETRLEEINSKISEAENAINALKSAAGSFNAKKLDNLKQSQAAVTTTLSILKFGIASAK